MGHPVALDTNRWIAERAVLERELAEERTALAHDDRYQIDGHLVDQPQFQTLPSHSPGRDCDNTVAGDLLYPRDGGLDAGGG